MIIAAVEWLEEATKILYEEESSLKQVFDHLMISITRFGVLIRSFSFVRYYIVVSKYQ